METVMTQAIKTTKVTQSRVSEVNLENITMGTNFTDHMFICDYENGEWQNPRIEPLALIPTHPAAMALHYGQAIFEGMKATLGKDGTPLLFRPYENAKRMNFSADRMGMPSFPEELFVEALKQFTALEKIGFQNQQVVLCIYVRLCMLMKRLSECVQQRVSNLL